MLKSQGTRTFRDNPADPFRQAHPNPDVYPWVPQRNPHTKRGIPGAADTTNVGQANVPPWGGKSKLLNRAATPHNSVGKGPKKDNLI